jgi:hypothetical protein
MVIEKLAILVGLALPLNLSVQLPVVQPSAVVHSSLAPRTADTDIEYRALCTPFGFSWPYSDQGTPFVFSP